MKVGGEGGAVSSSPYGSAFIPAITYGYIKMLGAEGLRKATEVAILNANYLSKKLEPVYPHNCGHHVGLMVADYCNPGA